MNTPLRERPLTGAPAVNGMEVAVLGVSAPGGTVAAWSAAAGHRVSLLAEDVDEVVETIERVERAVGAATGRIDGTTDLGGAVADAAIVVDATDRSIGARRGLLADVEDATEGATPIAVAAPGVAVTPVAVGLRRPARALGLRIPAAGSDAGPEVESADGTTAEIAVAEDTDADSLDRVREFVEGIGPTPLVVRDAPGGVVTRLDAALIAEAVRTVADGVADPATVDRAMVAGRDHRRGPLALADAIGLETVLSSMSDLADRSGERFAPPDLLRERVEAGALGRATGEGFHVWEDGEPTEPAVGPDPAPGAAEGVSDEP